MSCNFWCKECRRSSGSRELQKDFAKLSKGSFSKTLKIKAKETEGVSMSPQVGTPRANQNLLNAGSDKFKTKPFNLTFSIEERKTTTSKISP
jgi:hypothetical protein